MRLIGLLSAVLVLSIAAGLSRCEQFIPLPGLPEHCKQSTCQVIVQTERGGGTGSGVCIAAEDGTFHVLTNDHVGGSATAVQCRFPSGSVFVMERVATDPAVDLCLLRGKSTQQMPWVAIANKNPKIGDLVFQMGFPGEANGRLVERTGKVKAWGKRPNGRYVMMCDLQPNGTRPGDSGSPCCFTADGQLCGLVWGGDMKDAAACVWLGDLRQFVRQHLGERIFGRCPPGGCPITPAPEGEQPSGPGPSSPPRSPATTSPSSAPPPAEIDWGPVVTRLEEIAASVGLPWYVQLLLVVAGVIAAQLGTHAAGRIGQNILHWFGKRQGQRQSGLEQQIANAVRTVLAELKNPPKQP